jgi:hypothetical protein
MHRTTVFLTARQLRGLKEVGKVDGLSMSSLIRILLTEGIARRKRTQSGQIVLPGTRKRRHAASKPV